MATFVRGLSSFGLIVLAACGASRPRDGASVGAPPACPAQRVVIATNNWTQPVDLFAVVRGSQDPLRLGFINARQRDEIPVPAATAYVYARPVDAGSRSYIPRHAVEIRYGCR